MIVLDTNALRGMSLNGPQMSVLQRITLSRGHELCIPRIVYEEYVSSKAREIEEAKRQFQVAHTRLFGLYPYAAPTPRNLPDPKQIADEYYGRGLSEIFLILESTPSASVEALLREAHRRAPAKVAGGRGTGARDALVWLTIIENKPSSELPVYFVSNDKDAFGGPSGLLPELQSEAATTGIQVVYLRTIEELIATLASPAPSSLHLDFDPVNTIELVKERLLESYLLLDIGHQLGLLGDRLFVVWGPRGAFDVEYRRLLEQHAYVVDEIQ